MTKRSLLLSLSALVALAPAAAAQPRQGVPVAGPTPSGARLFVYDQGDALCGSVRRRGQRYRSEACGGGLPRLSTPIIGIDKVGPGDLAFLWGAVAPDVAAAEVVLADGRRVRTETSDGPAYRGRHAGKMRFFLVETRPGDEPLYVRLLDDAGQLLRAVEVHPEGGSPSGRTVLVARGRLGGERWRLSAFRRPRLLPLPGDEERIVEESCVDFGYSGHGGLQGPSVNASACADPDGALGPWAISVETACRAIGLSVVGLAPPGARRLVAVLGNGRRVRVPLRSLPARFGEDRAFALVLGPLTALRRLVATEDGRRRNLAGAIPPGTTNCPDSVTSYGVAFPGLSDEPRLGPGGPALQVRDEGVLLCATIGLPGPFDCSRPPIDEESSRILWHATDTGTFAAGVLPSQVASVVLEWDGGERQQVATTADGPYAGRYHGLVRFFTASLPGRRTLRRVDLLDAAGRRLLRVPAFQPLVFERGPVAVLRARRGWRVGAGAVRFPGLGRRALCLQLSRGAFDDNPLHCAGGGPNLEVSCRPRGMLLYGRLRPGVLGVEVETDRGVFRARTGPLPSRLDLSGRVFLVQLPARARPSTLAFEGRQPTRRRLRLPAAASQCGYGTII